MRLVVDTNVLVSALVWQGTPGRLLRASIGSNFEIGLSGAMVRELYRSMSKTKVLDRLQDGAQHAQRVTAQFVELTTSVELTEVLPVSRDPDDDVILATALAFGADLLVSGDKDLLVLESYEGIPIVTPAEALRRITAPPR